MGALATDEGEQWGWAVDYETAGAAQARALSECGGGCRVVLTFNRCAAYAADQDAASTAVGWAESYGSAAAAQQAALTECSLRGGSGCIVRVWGCNGPVVEEGLSLDRAARRQVQEGLQAAGFDPGGVDGMFGPRTRAAIRGWQSSRGARPTGYLDGPGVEALRSAGGSGPATGAASPAPVARQPASTAALSAPPAAGAELEGLFWQSIMNSANPAEFEAYLAQFPNGVFRALAEARLAALRAPAGTPSGAAGSRVDGAGSPAVRSPVPGGRVAGAPAPAAGIAAGDAARPRPGDVFRDCDACPELVVVPAGRFRMGCVSGTGCRDSELPVHEVAVASFALGVHEVTFAEYERFAAATGRDRPNDRGWGGGARPVINVSWEDAAAYADWLSGETGARYRLPSESEWEYAARAGAETAHAWGNDIGFREVCNWANYYGCRDETEPVGSLAANGWGLHDMHGNVLEWVADCWHRSYAGAPRDGSAWTSGGCGARTLRGGSWRNGSLDSLRSAHRDTAPAGHRLDTFGFRVARTLR